MVNWNKSLLDTSRLQYIAWQTWLEAITPNPQLEETAYRPVGWANQQIAEQLSGEGAEEAQSGANTWIDDGTGEAWVFDAVLQLNHSHSQRITQHPVQTGASKTDHSFSLPSNLTLEIGMSDVMDSFNPGQWGTAEEAPTRSVQAFQKLLEWKNAGTPLNITTRLNTYENMVIALISAPDDFQTFYGLKCSVTFQQIFVASMEEGYTGEFTSDREAVTNKTDEGTKGDSPARATDYNRNSKAYDFIFGDGMSFGK